MSQQLKKKVSTSFYSTALNWSELPPDQEGWWWFLDHGIAWITMVKKQSTFGKRLYAYNPYEHRSFPVDEEKSALWAGPISYPREP